MPYALPGQTIAGRGGRRVVVGAVAAPAAYSFVNSEAQAFVARFTTPPSNAYKAALDTLVGRLKVGRLNASNLLTAFDVFYVHAAPDAQAAVLNLADSLVGRAASYTATLSSAPAPIFHPGYGFTSDGVASYVEWGGWMPSLGSQYARNSACFGFWTRDPDSNGGSFPPAGAVTGNPFIWTRNGASGNISYRINDATTTTAVSSITDGSGLHVACRPDSATKRLFKNGVAQGSDAAVASTAPSAVAIRSGNGFATFCRNQLPFAFAGRNLTANENADLYDALGEYLTNIAWVALQQQVTGAANVQSSSQLLPTYSNFVALPTNPLGTFTGGNVATANKGFTNTGMARDPRDGTWWVAAFGRNVQGDTTSTFQNRIVHLDTDRATPLGVIDLTALGATDSTQGLAFDSSDNTLFVSVSGNVYHLAADHSTSAFIGSPITGLIVNAICYDSTRDLLVLNGTWYTKAGVVASPRRSVSFPYLDQTYYEAATDTVWATGGPNYDATYTYDYLFAVEVQGQNYGNPRIRGDRIYALTGARAIEGVSKVGALIYIGQDLWYHGPGAGSLANATMTYAAPY